jgi:hypothetical protein
MKYLRHTIATTAVTPAELLTVQQITARHPRHGKQTIVAIGHQVTVYGPTSLICELIDAFGKFHLHEGLRQDTE